MKYLNSLFIQPTFACALDCPGCYVKESTHGKQLGLQVFSDLLDRVWTSKGVSVKQVTIAVDNIPKFNVEAREVMVGVLDKALTLKENNPSGIELHITANGLNTLFQYVKHGISISRICKQLDLLSVSHIHAYETDAVDIIKNEYKDLKINYNYTHSYRYDIDIFKEVLEHVDMSYYVLHKAGLGRDNDAVAIEVFKEGLRAMTNWPQELKNKISVDNCVKDAFEFKKTGFGCDANVSRMQVWPDGHVTGCPYNKDGGIVATTAEEIINNITAVGKKYEFNTCTIPRDYAKRTTRSLAILC